MIVRLDIDYWGVLQSGFDDRKAVRGLTPLVAGKKLRIRINITALYAFIPPPAPASILTVV